MFEDDRIIENDGSVLRIIFVALAAIGGIAIVALGLGRMVVDIIARSV